MSKPFHQLRNPNLVYLNMGTRMVLDWLMQNERRKLCDELDYVVRHYVEDALKLDYDALKQQLADYATEIGQ